MFISVYHKSIETIGAQSQLSLLCPSVYKSLLFTSKVLSYCLRQLEDTVKLMVMACINGNGHLSLSGRKVTKLLHYHFYINKHFLASYVHCYIKIIMNISGNENKTITMLYKQ